MEILSLTKKTTLTKETVLMKTLSLTKKTELTKGTEGSLDVISFRCTLLKLIVL